MSNALILEGGGMRGIFAAGAIDYLLDQEIRFDNVIGVSAGACHGCSYVCGQRGRAYATATDYLDEKDYCSMRSLRKTGDLFGADFLYYKIPQELYPIDNEAFLKSGIKFQAVVTNCETGEPEYPVIKDMFEDIEYVRASSSLPFLANMVEIDGKLYMDGGISDSIPLAQSLRQGNEKKRHCADEAAGLPKKSQPRHGRRQPEVWEISADGQSAEVQSQGVQRDSGSDCAGRGGRQSFCHRPDGSSRYR